MPEEPRCAICLGEFNDIDCPPYIPCQKGGHAFCKGCIRDMIPDSRNMDVTNIHGEKYAIYINFRVSAPMAECQTQFNCPICREKTSLFDNEPIRRYPFFPVFTCQRIPLRYLKEHADTPSRSIEEREKISREITSKTIELEMMASTFAKMVTDFKETEGKQLAEVKEEYEALVQKTIALEQNKEALSKTIADLNKTHTRVGNSIAAINREHRMTVAAIEEREKEMRETIQKNKDTLMGEMYRQARADVKNEMKDDREKMMQEIEDHRLQAEKEMLSDYREQEEQFKIAMEARKADTELAYQIRRNNLERDIKLVERSLAKLNTQYEKMKEDAKGMTKHYYDEEMAKIKSMVAKSRQKIEHELDQFSATRKEFGEYMDMKRKFIVQNREISHHGFYTSYKFTTTQIIPDEEIMKWSNLIGLLDSPGSDSRKISIEDYMEFRLKNKKAKQNGEHWTNYSLGPWLKNKIKIHNGSTAGW